MTDQNTSHPASMTGFSRIEGNHGDTQWVFEGRSVNGRSLDVKLRLPSGFEAVERAAKELARTRFQRGQVSLSLNLKRPEIRSDFTVNQTVLNHYLEIGNSLLAQGQATMPSLDGLLALKGVIDTQSDETETDEGLEAALLAGLEAALDGLKQSRQDEGAALFAVLTQHLSAMAVCVSQAEALSGQQVQVIRERFERRLAELLPEADMQERILQEAAVLAVKADVREELDRLKVHIVSAHQLLGQKTSQGRKLDFLSQEFMREANTLCSKAAFTELTQTGLELKSIIDQFREQIQNVE
ncbi:MAG: YicC/YloC family endoribonuclease [Asticcacaulis sp.]